MTLPERFETMRAEHTGTRTTIYDSPSTAHRGYWCSSCRTESPCDTIKALDALDLAMRFIEHTAYDAWRAGELLQEAKAVIDQIGDGE